MRNRLKMELINNYVDIYKILYSCKYLLHAVNDLEGSECILKAIKDSLKLKDNYEKSFSKLHIADTSFLLLKKQLEEGLNHPHSENFTPVNLNKINEANTKIYKKLIDTSLRYKLDI